MSLNISTEPLNALDEVFALRSLRFLKRLLSLAWNKRYFVAFEVSLLLSCHELIKDISLQGMAHLLSCNQFDVVCAVIDVLSELVSPGISPVCFVLCDQARPEVRA